MEIETQKVETEQQPVVETKTATTTPVAKESTAPKRAFEVKEPPKEVLAQSFDSSDADLGLEENEQSGAAQSSNTKGGNAASAGSNEGVANGGKTPANGEAETSGKEKGKAASEAAAVGEDKTKTEAKPSVIGEQVKPVTGQRDYSGFSDEEVRYLKQMSNTAFDFASKQLREKKQLETEKNNIYLQNPDAYQLDPQFKTIREDVTFFSQERQHWQQQLMNIKAGKQWTELQGWDKSGNPVYSQPKEPTDLAEEEVRQRMLQADGLVRQASGSLQQLQQSYTQRIQQDTQQIREIQAQKFAWAADAKVLEHVINVEGVGDKTIGQIKTDFMSLLPPYHRTSLISDIAADMFVALQIYAAQVRELKAQNQITETKRQEVMRGEPTSNARPRTEANGKSRFGGPTSFDDLPSL